MIRALAVAIALGLLVSAAPAQAGILSAEDATELAQSLAEALEEQGVCYSWNVTNDFDSSDDVGSGLAGPGEVRTGAQCTKGFVELNGNIHYACGSCEDEDSASISIRSDLPNPPTVKDLEGLGLKAGDLTGDNDDTTLVNMVNALPLLVADRGNAPYIEYEQATPAEVPPTDRATDTPGSDLLRDSWFVLLLFGALILGGPGYYLYKRGQMPQPRPQTDQPTPPSPAT